jgi:dTDP-4-amino-4,6-dideoxygalactose transaminase
MDELALLGGPRAIEMPGPHFSWPRITSNVEAAVIRQLRSALSIYDRSGIVKEFEDTFASYHGRLYALTSNSGTSAIFSMYEGIGLKPGDEVICPVYTFFATVSPLMHTGAIPVFCDCLPDGNIDPRQLEALITPRTRAVVVTHMWGLPCDMPKIVDVCRRHRLRLLEDCSHAHGARVDGRLVGTFGDAAAWSLQAQKTVTGGEGGVMLTDDQEIYYRAMLQGHYNKRCLQEIASEHPLSEFSRTGFGLKLRAHPLALAIALEQFGHLEDWLAQREQFAAKISAALKEFPFLRLPDTSGKRHGWYAYVMQFEAERANGINVDMFFRAARAEGLVELDRPNSTRPLNHFPLFNEPSRALPRLYAKGSARTARSFPVAERFSEAALKLPVWSFEDESPIVDAYIAGLVKVARAVRDRPERLLRRESPASEARC